MCNLYDIGPGEGKRNETTWEKLAFRGLKELRSKIFGIRKTDPGLVLTSGTNIETMRWGFVRSFNPAINNARSDKLEGGMWKSAWEEKRRCIIPMSTYYEWSGPTGDKQTHAFQASIAEQWIWAAGLWEDSAEHGYCYSMLTTAGSEKTSHIHDRMPALLTGNQLDEFLESDNPIHLIEPSSEVSIARCENPLKNPNHDGPVFISMLPGFD
ncbi:MAG: SOS response-associated peptidase family protein [Verrucomicrobiales bacterium]|nr:SOS response-associated peptidase family protein [Verrucomicrobiales bacterium]